MSSTLCDTCEKDSRYMAAVAENASLKGAAQGLGELCDKQKAENTKLQAENAKLREELDQWHSLTAGIELPEYPVTQFKPKDLERENAELRELLRDMYHCSRQVGCDRCGDGYRRSCSVLDRMRELGIEVG